MVNVLPGDPAVDYTEGKVRTQMCPHLTSNATVTCKGRRRNREWVKPVEEPRVVSTSWYWNVFVLIVP